ncbi:MAG: TraB/TrbI/VirB10 family type IV secretion system protein [Gammaproteobacteria bacterium]
MKAPAVEPRTESDARPAKFHKTSRRIHYWILALVLAAVTGSFLFLHGSRTGAAPATPGWASPRPGGHLVNWAIPRKSFLSTLIREAATRVRTHMKKQLHPPTRGGSRRGRWHPDQNHRLGTWRGGRLPAHRFPSPGGSRWTQVEITAHASPILAWPARAAVSRFRARATALQTLLTRMGSPAPGQAPPGKMDGVLKMWSKRFASAGAPARTAHDHRWLKRLSRHPLPRPEYILPPPKHPTLMPGSVIPAVLVSEIDSDLPGMIVARVTRTIDDSVHEREVMIPMGSTLVGYYSSDVNQGQTRVLASFSEIIFPDGRRVPLAGMAAADAYGASGLQDEVRTHFWKIFGSSFLIAALSAFLPADQSSIVLTPGVSSGALVGSAAGQALAGASQAILERNESISPTLVIRPGFRFLVMVNRPITLSGQPG